MLPQAPNAIAQREIQMNKTTANSDSVDGFSVQMVPSEILKRQVKEMVEAQEDWIPDADGIDHSKHVVLNEFTEGVWLCAHNGEANAKHFTRLQRLA